MKQVVVALLKLPTGEYVFQRRTNDAPVNAGLIGFFGGHVEGGETFDEAVRRELKEETSLELEKLTISYVESFIVDREGEQVEYHLYEAPIESANFNVYEGVAAESYNLDELLQRHDLTSSVEYVARSRITRKENEVDQNS